MLIFFDYLQNMKQGVIGIIPANGDVLCNAEPVIYDKGIFRSTIEGNKFTRYRNKLFVNSWMWINELKYCEGCTFSDCTLMSWVGRKPPVITTDNKFISCQYRLTSIHHLIPNRSTKGIKWRVIDDLLVFSPPKIVSSYTDITVITDS